MLLNMLYREISLKKIDFEDETFRISEELECEPLVDSMREIGQMNPVVFLEVEGQKKIVCGFRRLYGLRQLKASKVLARFLEEKDINLTGIFDFALWDNLSHRKLEPLETARAVYKLKNIFGLSDEILVKTYLPRLGLSPHKRSLHAQLRLHTSIPEIRKCFKEGRLTLASVKSLSEMLPESQKTIASAMQKMHLSSSLQRKFFALLEDVAAMNDSAPAAFLNNVRVANILDNDRLSYSERGDRVFEILYRKRYPKVSQAGDLFLKRKKSLGLPGSLRITADPYFEKQDLHVEFTAADAENFRELADALSKASRKPELDLLFRIVE